MLAISTGPSGSLGSAALRSSIQHGGGGTHTYSRGLPLEGNPDSLVHVSARAMRRYTHPTARCIKPEVYVSGDPTHQPHPNTSKNTKKIPHSCAGRGGVLRVASPMRERGRGASFRVESSQTRGQFRRARSPARTFETENDQRVRVEVSRGVESV